MGDKLPHCFGMYKKYNYACDGKELSTDSKERSPCAIKKICRAFRDHLKKHSLDTEFFLQDCDGGLESNGPDGAVID